MITPPFSSFIEGRWTNRGEPRVRENPARSAEIAAAWRAASPDEAQAAIAAARHAFAPWSGLALSERATRLEKLLAAVEASAADFVALIVRENGKTRREAEAEIRSGLGDARAVITSALGQRITEHAAPANTPACGELILEPLGVCALITPWNFPLATILRKLVPALVYGNTAVVKPSELTPGPACLLFEVLRNLDFPAGVASLVLGPGGMLGPALVSHPEIRAISFTGSQRAGLSIASLVAGRDVRVQLEMGGKNSLLVLAPTDLDDAVAAAITGGFSCAGQWCTGTGRVIVEDSLHDAFVERLLPRVTALRVGPGDDSTTDVGPVVSAARVEFAEAAVAQAVASGAAVGCGGTSRAEGYYFSPTVLTGVTESMGVFAEELFVPVLPIVRARDAEDALRLANLGTFGLTASVFCSDQERATQIARRIEAGIVHVNLHTAYREPQLPVCAWRESGRGLPEGGRFARDFYTRSRVLYVRR